MTSKLSAKQSLKTRVTLGALSVFVLSLWTLSYFAYWTLRQDLEDLMGRQQLATVTILATNIQDEIEERFSALNEIATTLSPMLADQTRAVQKVLEQRPLLGRLFNAGVIAYRQDGTAMAETPLSARRVGVNYMDIDTIAAALRQGQSTVGQPVMGKMLKVPVFGMTVPVRDSQGQVIGALSGVTRLTNTNFLERLFQPHYGKTGGYMVIDARHRLIVTATDKRRILQQLPKPGHSALLDQFVRGYEGSGVTTNAAGIKVLASAKAIPAAGWYVAAALPTDEAFAPIHSLQQRMLVATVLLTLLAAGLTWWMLHRQLAPLMDAAAALAKRSDSELPPQPLPIVRQDEIGQLIGGFNQLLDVLAKRDAALRDREGRLRAITDNSSTVIYMKDLAGRYIYVNRQFEQIFHKSNTSVQGETDFDLFPHDLAQAIAATDQKIAQTGQPLKIEERVPQDDGIHTYLSVKFPLRRANGDIYAVCGISTDISQRKHSEVELKIAAVAFESQEGIVVLDPKLHFLRVNNAFTRITGFTAEEAQGKHVNLLRSNRHPDEFYEMIWQEIQYAGHWQGAMWQRRKNGNNFATQVTISVVRDAEQQITHFVGNFTDETHNHLREQQRLIDEAVLRETLVREVHHRIKNNLQGITGLLRQFAQNHPVLKDSINQAIGQVQGISVIHGLHGRTGSPRVRLCELTSAIGSEIQTLWQTQVALDIPPGWTPFIVAESEAVPVALILNELIVNAVKHGGKAAGQIQVRLRQGAQLGSVNVSIVNPGLLGDATNSGATAGAGLQLIRALMPRDGAHLLQEQHDDNVVTKLDLSSPVISLDPLSTP